MRRLDGQPYKKKPVRWLLFPPGQSSRPRPLPRTGHSHIAMSYRNAALKGDARLRLRRTLCGTVFDIKTNAWMNLDRRRYYVNESIEWDRVTCAVCQRFRDEIK